MANEQRRLERDKAKKQLRREVMEAEGTMSSVVDDVVEHLYTHYDHTKDDHFRRDFVLVISASFFGHHKQTGQAMQCSEFFAEGDMHALSHVMADRMKQSKEFAALMFHAVECYCHMACRDIANEL